MLGQCHLCPGGAEFTISSMGDSRVSLTHHFLIAMPSMADPHFAHTLIYICEHNDQGALGIVVNKPIDMTLSALFEQINIPLGDSDLRETKVHYGGPVQIDRGFVLHRPLGGLCSPSTSERKGSASGAGRRGAASPTRWGRSRQRLAASASRRSAH